MQLSMKRKCLNKYAKNVETIDYEKIIRSEIRKRKIRVQKWCTEEPENSYEAYISTRVVRIPKPVDSFHFHVCLHEIGHVVTGERLYGYLQEYNAEKWAIERAEYYGLIDEDYIRDAKVYVLKHCITDVMLHGLKHTQIRKYVLDWIGLDYEEFKDVVLQNGMKLVMNYIYEYWQPKNNAEIVHDIYVDRKTKTRLAVTVKN